MKTFIERATGVMSGVASLAIAALALLGLIDIILRTTAGAGIRGVVEYSVLLLVIAAYTSLAQAQRDGAHINTSVITQRFSGRVANMMRSVGLVVGLIVLAIVSALTVQLAWESVITAESRYGIVNFPLWPGRTAVALGFVLLTLNVAVSALEQWKALKPVAKPRAEVN